ncbi:serine hydrolase, partial [Mycolicibacterium poriferae]|uniref:serine hydrolase n=1 Tax=Mycolicibacterium poriferae TaxID=39694 RepID=UPI0024BAE76A
MSLRAALSALALVAATGCAPHDLRDTPPTPGAPAASDPFAQALYKSGFTGEAVVSRRPGDLSSVSIGRAARDEADNPERGPWASVTKQVLAVLAIQQVEAGGLDLDAPA